jgi:DNA-binding beta-propeller fold protein YncE
METKRSGFVSRHRTWAAVVILSGLVVVALGLAQPAMASGASPYWLVGAWGSRGAGDGQFGSTFEISVTPDGSRVYVADAEHQRVEYFKSNGTYLGQWGSMGHGWGAFQYPCGVAVSPDGARVYVADADDSRIQYFDLGGAWQGQWGSNGSGPGLLNAPCSLAFSPDGSRLYVADTGNDRVQYFSPTGSAQGLWGSHGTTAGLFSGARNVAVRADGTVYVADQFNHRIEYFAPDGDYLGQWGSIFSSVGSLDRAFDVAVAADGTSVVTDVSFRTVQCFAGGVFGGQIGTLGSDPGQFYNPCTAAFGPDGTLYVGDGYSGRIQSFRHDVAPPATIDDAPAGWSKVPVTVTLTPTDDLSGSLHTFWQIDGGTWTAVLGTGAVAPIVAPPADRHIPVLVSGDGAHTLSFYSDDNAGNVETTLSRTIRIDSVPPLPVAVNDVSVKRCKTANLRYLINDATSPTCAASIKVFTARGRLVKTLSLTGAASNHSLTAAFRCTLAKGVYRWKVYATDLAGNVQAQPSVRRLTVR